MKIKLCDCKGERATAVNAKLRMRLWRTRLGQGAVYLVWNGAKNAKNSYKWERKGTTTASS